MELSIDDMPIRAFIGTKELNNGDRGSYLYTRYGFTFYFKDNKV